MTSKEFDYLVFIGRFQPFHNGHMSVVKQALEKAHNLVIVVGSSFAARSTRNPFTAGERIKMVTDSLSEDEKGRVHLVPVSDHPYNYDKWLAEVQGAVHAVALSEYRAGPTKIGLIGHDKDHSSSYLKSFPQWKQVEVTSHEMMHATDVRENYFAGFLNAIPGEVPLGTQLFLNAFYHDCEDCPYHDDDDEYPYRIMADEQEHVEIYKDQWRDAPYPPIFHTVDALVIQGGHILLVKRGAQPGEGLHALPGGFINEYETRQDAVLRELREETKIKVPQPVLAGSIDSVKTFDDPYRSSRGRTITTAYLINLKPSDKFPEVKGGDDATKAFWVPLSELNREEMFEDHYHIIEYMVGL